MKYEDFLAANNTVRKMGHTLAAYQQRATFIDDAHLVAAALTKMRDEAILSLALQIEAAVLIVEYSDLLTKEPTCAIEVVCNGDIHSDEMLRKMMCKKVATEIADAEGVAHNFTATLRPHTIGNKAVVIGFDLATVK